jgi:hypothetical protein
MAVYRSANGRAVDMSQLASKHEKVRAVGNMNVNARGDVIDSNNKIVKDNTKRVKTNYNKTVNKNVPKPQVKQVPATPLRELTPEEQMFEDEDEDIKK